MDTLRSRTGANNLCIEFVMVIENNFYCFLTSSLPAICPHFAFQVFKPERTRTLLTEQHGLDNPLDIV